MSSTNEHVASPPKTRMSPLELRNTDLVSRLLAATPPYLYNMSLLPNTYFFSEMLRSIVQAKTESNNRPCTARRTRKRPWSTPKTTPPLKEWTHEKTDCHPLELTTKTTENEKCPPINNNNLIDRTPPPQINHLFPPLPSQDGLILPPPPPMWYPPLYPTPPYGIDPLHFFIDLRVSGHIYDKKNETQVKESENNMKSEEKTHSSSDLLFKQRHTSAFSVPEKHVLPMNLSHNDSETGEIKTRKFDVKSMMGFEKECNQIGTSYIMSNIQNIYKRISNLEQNDTNDEDNNKKITEDEGVNKEETDEERQKRVKDLRALIGLELVVDYMNYAKPTKIEAESIGSPALEVVDDET